MRSQTCRSSIPKVESFDKKFSTQQLGPIARDVEEVFDLLGFRIHEDDSGLTFVYSPEGDLIRETTVYENNLFFALQSMAHYIREAEALALKGVQ